MPNRFWPVLNASLPCEEAFPSRAGLQEANQRFACVQRLY